MASLAKKMGAGIFLSFSFVCGIVLYVMTHQIVDFSVLENYNPKKASILLDDQGQEWARFAYEQRKYVPLSAMPPMLIHAFIATEDHNFFSHCGVSFKGIIRSIAINLITRKKAQGASTITQQLVRLLFFDAKKTFVRKIKEQLLSLLVEMQFTKQQILETYLNHVYFGHGVYGVQAASHYFWSKDVADLSIDQAALLAGMVKAPLYYSPIIAPDAARSRRDTVLSLLCKRGYISAAEKAVHQAQQVVVQHEHEECKAPHLKEYIRIILEKQFGKQKVYGGGLVIQTTLDSHLQATAMQGFTKQVEVLKKTLDSSVDGAVISCAPQTGEIKAMVGGYNFSASSFNRAVQAKRQMGSILKPLVYSAALQAGFSFQDVLIDEPFEIVQGGQVWQPKNNTQTFLGPMTRAYGLIRSNNIIAIKTLLDAGPQAVADLAMKAHLVSYAPAYPSLALGCIDTTLMQAMSLFALFANHGVYVTPHCIRWVKDEFGHKIFKAEVVQEPILSSKVASQVVHVLTHVVAQLEDFMHSYLPFTAFGKTGTTNDSRTCWFCGGTANLVTAVYIGKDNNSPFGPKVYSTRTAFPIWFFVYKSLGMAVPDFSYDGSLQQICIDKYTGTAQDNCNDERALTILV